jgi:hypothetical protein
MTRRTMAERKRRASERDARRESLLVLLSRTRRGVPLTPAEAALLFAHVEVELAEADELRRTVAGQQTAIQAAGSRAEAAEAAIVEAEKDRDAALAELAAHQAAEAQRVKQGTSTHYRARAEQAEEHLAAYVGIFGPEAPDDFHTMQHRAKQAEAAIARVRDTTQRMRAGSPQGAAAIYADRIEQALADDPYALTPEQTAVHVAFGAAADSAEARLAEQQRAHEIELATVRRATISEQQAETLRREVSRAEGDARAEQHRADRYRLAWFAARRDRRADRAAMAAELPFVDAGRRQLAAIQAQQ